MENHCSVFGRKLGRERLHDACVRNNIVYFSVDKYAIPVSII